MRLFQFSFVLSVLFRPGENFVVSLCPICYHITLLKYLTEREDCFEARKTYFQLDRKLNQ